MITGLCYIYENNVLKRILVDGGYIEGDNYYFYVNDHLGNNRIVADAAASVVQSTQYYPFGSSFADAMGGSVQPYKYNGKELDTRNGLNMSDYSARLYDPVIPYFGTVDPLAEKYYSWSPYVYTFNNSLRFTDPTGMGPEDGIFGDILKALKQVVNEVLHEVGLSGNQIQSDNPAVREDASQKRIATAENIETANDVLTTITPVGGAAAVLSNADQENYLGALAAVPFAVLDLGTGGKSSGVVKGAKAIDKVADAAKVVDKVGDATNIVKKGSLSGTKAAVKEAHKQVGGPLPKGKPGKMGSPQRGNSKRGYRLDPGHPNRSAGDPESGPHINWWDYTKGKRGSGGGSGAIPIK